MSAFSEMWWQTKLLFAAILMVYIKRSANRASCSSGEQIEPIGTKVPK